MYKKRRLEDVHVALYPEVLAGGFSRVDGTVAFYQRVNALLRPDMMVVDFGAGRGRLAEDPVRYRRQLRQLRGKVALVLGVDVDEAVLSNPLVDQGLVVEQGQRLPIEDGTVDLVVSDFTFEHVSDPDWAAGELTRVLKHQGWLCARTPNKWGYIGIPTRLLPNRFHLAALRRLQPQKSPDDTFPTEYRLNTMTQLKQHFPPERFENCTYTLNSEPAYVGSSTVASRIVRAGYRLTPLRLGSMLFVFLRKR